VGLLLALIALGPTGFAQEDPPAEESAGDQSQDEPRQEEALPVLGRSTPGTAAQPRSLAEVARNVRLQQPSDDEGIVISNSNLQEIGDQGWVSVTGTAQGPLLGAAAPAGGDRTAWEERYREQRDSIDKLEAWLRANEEAMRQVPDPYRQGRGAHSYAPGRQSEIQLQRSQLEAQLELERAKLDRMQQQGRRLGVDRGWYAQEEQARQQEQAQEGQ
jgi:hypothetical protein